MNQELHNYLLLLKTDKPTKPGMYLSLLHGRNDPGQDMDGWGDDGPMFGPLAWCHITYLTSINLCALGDDDGTGPMMTQEDPLRFVSDTVYYDGMYYGDFELVVAP
jgi:hypothetical protein